MYDSGVALSVSGERVVSLMHDDGKFGCWYIKNKKIGSLS